jgi:hypothetical protein
MSLCLPALFTLMHFTREKIPAPPRDPTSWRCAGVVPIDKGNMVAVAGEIAEGSA